MHHETDAGREFLLKSSDADGPLVVQMSPSTRDCLTVKPSQLGDLFTIFSTGHAWLWALAFLTPTFYCGHCVHMSFGAIHCFLQQTHQLSCLLIASLSREIQCVALSVEFLRSGKWSTLRATQRALQQPRGRMHRGSLDDSTSHDVALKLCQDETWKMEPLV